MIGCILLQVGSLPMQINAEGVMESHNHLSCTYKQRGAPNALGVLHATSISYQSSWPSTPALRRTVRGDKKSKSTCLGRSNNSTTTLARTRGQRHADIITRQQSRRGNTVIRR